MNVLRAVWLFFFPPSKWAQCHPMTDAERLAAFELRLGQWKAAERLRIARVAQVFDDRAMVRPKVQPKLPKDNVVQMRRKRAA